MDKSDMLLMLLLEELLSETGVQCKIKHPTGELEDYEWETIQEILTEEVKDRFYEVILDKLIEVLKVSLKLED